ncbi:Cystathionine beta-lyase [hydrothermal vent metagenome]|uniref:Cystathionine beta-lyase n=1 Tax=hydrothermal vent metagenome TaxID=652676 RepID=A0A3B0R4P7_9ZZZZ
MSVNDKKNSGYAAQTKIAHAGRQYAVHGMVNPGVYHASTITVPTLKDWFGNTSKYGYGRYGTPTLRALEESVADLEGGHGCCLFPSGLAAITSSLLIMLQQGDHLLVTDSAYRPTRNFCNEMLTNMGVETTYYDPCVGAGIEALIKPNTRVIFLESPGSLTMEMQDIPAIVKVARQKGIVTIIDNTWGAGHYFKPLAFGCDISVQAGTKYIVGHSDVMLGTATTSQALWENYRNKYKLLGQHVGPDDVYLALRGLHTIDVRLERHMKNALTVAKWLRERDEVAEVLHPGLPDAAGHDLWKRDYNGACGLFSIRLKNSDRKAIAAMIDNLSLFGIGASWGGFESLVIPFEPASYRTATKWPHTGTSLRFHIGLEAPQDLIADLEAGFERMLAATIKMENI